jgi:hypothetical protein
VYIDNILSVIFTFSFELTERYCQYQQINSDAQNYLTLCRFSFEIKESGDKRMVWHCTRFSVPNYFVVISYHWNAGKTHQCKQHNQSDYLMFIITWLQIMSFLIGWCP